MSELFDIIKSRADTKFPIRGDKLIFTGVPKFYYPNFINMRKDAEDRLELNKEYVIAESRVNSSWVTIYLEEFPGVMFNLNFFKQV